MALEADAVIVALEAQTGAFNADVKASARGFDQSMSTIERAATRAETAIKKSSDNSRVSQQILQHVSRSAADQFAAGTPVMQIFTQHLAQVAEAGAYAGGSLGKFGAFLGGPWGIAVTLAATVAGTLFAKLLEGGNSVDDLVEKMRSQARQSEKNDQAAKIYSQSIDGQREATRKLNEEMGKALVTSEAAEKQAYAEAQAHLSVELAERKRLAGLLALNQELARATIERANGPGGANSDARALGIAPAQSRVAAIEQQIAENDAAIAAAERTLGLTAGAVAKTAADHATDPIKRINDQYDQMAASATAASVANKALQKSLEGLDPGARAAALAKERNRLTAELAGIERRRQAALKVEQDARRAGGPDGDLTAFQSPLHGPITGRFGEQRKGHLHAGVDVGVPVGTRVGAAAAGTVIEAGTLPGYGNVVIIDHGRGTITRYAHLSSIGVTKGQAVDVGQAIGLSGGAKGTAGAGDSTGPHLHYEVRRNGRAVDPLKAMFPTDGVAAAKGAQQAVEAVDKAVKRLSGSAKKEMVSLANDFQSLQDHLDPTAAAAREFRQELDLIDRWEAAGPNRAAAALEARFQALARAAKPILDKFKETLAIDERLTRQNNRDSKPGLGNAKDALAQSQQEAEGQIRDLADLYETLFTGGTKNLWAEFKREGLRALALLAAQETFKLITGQNVKMGGQGGLGSLFGGSGGSGGLLSQITSLFGGGGGSGGGTDVGKALGLFKAIGGRASGGYVGPGSLHRVNESHGGIELLRMGPQGGTIIPLGQMRAASPAGGVTIIHAPQFHLRSPVVTGDLIAEMDRRNRASLAAAAPHILAAARKQAPGALASFQGDGTVR